MSTFSLHEIRTNPRDGADYSLPFEDYATLAQAKKSAKKLKGRWAIIEAKVVAQGDNSKTKTA